MPRTYSNRYLVALVVILMLVSVINVADKELLSPVADVVRRELNMNDTQLGVVRSTVFLAALIGQFIWGPLSDRWVRKNIIAIGAILWSSVTWMTAFVGSYPQLLAARASMSFAEGCFNPSAYALITDSVPKHRHGLILGLMGLTYPIGTASALVLARIIGTQQWRQPFLYYGVIGIVLGVLVFLIVREPRRGENEEAVQARSGEYTGRFSFREFRKVLLMPTVLLAFGLDTAQAGVNWSIAFWAPTYLTRYKIAPTGEAAAVALLPAILGFVLGALLGGVLIDRLRKRTPLAAVYVALFAMTGGLVMALLVFNIFNLTWLMVAAFFLGLITYTVMPAVNLILFGVVPPETKATTISASNILINLVTGVVSVAIGMISDAYGLRLAFGGAVIVLFALGILTCLGLLRTMRTDMDRRQTLIESRVAV